MTLPEVTTLLAGLGRWPDVDDPTLVAVDASDRLLLDLAAEDLARSGDGEVVTLLDCYGALTLGAVALGASDVRSFQDSVVGERALAANSVSTGLAGAYRGVALEPASVAGARVVLLQLPRSLDELDELAALVSHAAADDVVLYAAGRIKHMTPAMNEVLGRHFDTVDVGHARQKSRPLVARGPRRSAVREPSRQFHADLGMWVVATGAAFAGTRLDIGTRALLAVLGQAAPDARSLVDLGCGTGVVAAWLGLRRPEAVVLATDVSAGAAASGCLTAEANGLSNVTVTQDDALSQQPDASADLVVLNPPFHLGGTVHTGVASKLFAAAARVLRPGGELWTVYNSHLGYRGELQRVVGPTREVSRTPKFTVTASTREI